MEIGKKKEREKKWNVWVVAWYVNLSQALIGPIPATKSQTSDLPPKR